MIEHAVQDINSDDMLGLVVPWTVLAPVVRGHFFPRVVVLVAGGEEFHLVFLMAASMLRGRDSIAVTGAGCLVANDGRHEAWAVCRVIRM